MPGKGRAIGYTDYYKGKDRTPGAYDDEEEISKNRMGNPAKAGVKRFETADDKRKAVLRRRLQRLKAGK